MRVSVSILRAALLSTALVAATAPAARAQVLPYRGYGGVGQHATVMNDIQRAQRRNDAAISHVQNNIRSTRPKVY